VHYGWRSIARHCRNGIHCACHQPIHRPAAVRFTRVPEAELLLQFEPIVQLPEEELNVVRKVLESLIIKYQISR